MSLIESYYPNTCGRIFRLCGCVHQNSFNCHHIQLLTAQCVQPPVTQFFFSTIIPNTTQPDKETALRRGVAV